MLSANSWFYWALLSAVFAAMTAIFAKIGLEGIDSDYATLIRTFVIILVLAGFVYSTGKWSDPFALNPKTWQPSASAWRDQDRDACSPTSSTCIVRARDARPRSRSRRSMACRCARPCREP